MPLNNSSPAQTHLLLIHENGLTGPDMPAIAPSGFKKIIKHFL